jgi:transposase
VVDFVNAYNAKNGRGGQSEAARKFNISILTVSAWLKKSGSKAGKAVVSGKASAKVSSALTSKVASLIQMSDRIHKAEAELAKLRAGYESLKASIRSAI